MSYAKEEIFNCYKKWRFAEKAKDLNKASLFKELYKHMVKNTSGFILIKI